MFFNSLSSSVPELSPCLPVDSRAKLYQVEEGEYEYPHQIHKVPVEAHFFHQLIILLFFQDALPDQDEYDEVDHDTAEYVEAVESRDEEKEVSEERSRTVFIAGEVCSLEELTVLFKLFGF